MDDLWTLLLAAASAIVLLSNAIEKIIKAVKKGHVSRAALQRCCANVVNSVFNSAIQREYIDTMP